MRAGAFFYTAKKLTGGTREKDQTKDRRRRISRSRLKRFSNRFTLFFYELP